MADMQSTAGRMGDVGDTPTSARTSVERFYPKAPKTAREAGISDSLVESLVYKTLLEAGNMTSRGIVRATALPVEPVVELLTQMKARQLAFYKDSAAMGDFEYALTDAGRMRARLYMEESSYVGPAPVSLEAYSESVRQQGVNSVHPQESDLRRAFSDLLLNDKMFERLGPAINSGRGLFLYGFAGNGKTSIAERITDCFGDDVWVPYAIHAGGEIITLFDPQIHRKADDVPAGSLAAQNIDPRWVQIRRPTIVVGGELTLDSLDLCYNPHTKITEASLQLKSNTGTLVIDDFGRQRMRPIELLNRWIVPLEKRYDFLALANGKKIRAPFDQLIIFSTNLEPKDLVDEAFLRRIPYKINVLDPTEQEFRQLFAMFAPQLEVELPDGVIDYLIETHYRAVGRPFRCCQPRDLLLQVRNHAAYRGAPSVATREAIDLACDNYFATV